MRASAGIPLFKVTSARPSKETGPNASRVSPNVVRHVTTSGLAATAEAGSAARTDRSLEEDVEYWGGSAAVRRRLTELRDSSSS
ncbi:hypothetical protein, partial [Amycolatopsis sp. NPDC000740]|uniref:hypothetical protein n=1 Tax=Amycolatopsis sp. NPDC000740 TaxID=3154269 RepID=UPI0033178C4F